MKRKLFLGLAAMAALTITSCQKDLVINQIPEEQPIGFGTYVGRDAQTKADVIGKDNLLGNDKGFGVFAYYTGQKNFNADQDDVATGDQAPKPNFMYKQQVTGTKDGETYTWTYSPVKYWPETSGDKISFFAYAPYNASETFSSVDYEGAPTLTFTVNSNVSNQIDLLYAEPIYNKTKPASDAVDKTVAFTFKHALSRIGFKAAAVNTTDKIAVTKITLKGKFTPSGTCSLADGKITGTASTEDILYQLKYTDDNKITIIGTTAKPITADEGYIMIIPTNNISSSNPVTIEVEYELSTADNLLSGGYSAPVKQTATGTVTSIFQSGNPASEQGFEKGKAYTFVLNLSPNTPITFSVTYVTDWDTDIDNDDLEGDDDDIQVTPTQGV